MPVAVYFGFCLSFPEKNNESSESYTMKTSYYRQVCHYLAVIMTGLLCSLTIPCSMAFAGKIIGEQELLSLINNNGRARVIVTLKVNQFQSLASASARFTGGVDGAATVPNPDGALRLAIAGTASAVVSGLPDGSYAFDKSFSYTPAMVLEVDSTALAALQNNVNVLSVQEDRLSSAIPVTPSPGHLNQSIDTPQLNDSTSIIGANTVWYRGVTGKGVYVAILDSGVLSSHEMFTGKNFIEACFNSTYSVYSSVAACPNGKEVMYGPGAAAPPSNDPRGDSQHGTHVAGLAA